MTASHQVHGSFENREGAPDPVFASLGPERGLPVITTCTGGPLSFVNTVAGKPNGWLVEPDDVDALADALVEAVNDDDARKERADHARQQIRASYSWRALAERFDSLYTDLLDRSS